MYLINIFYDFHFEVLFAINQLKIKYLNFFLNFETQFWKQWEF